MFPGTVAGCEVLELIVRNDQLESKAVIIGSSFSGWQAVRNVKIEIIIICNLCME
jgi:hypothetical protein